MFRCGGQIVCAHFVCCFLLLVFRHGSSLSVRGGVPVFQDFPEGVAASDGTAVVDDDPWAPVTQAINDYHMQDFAVSASRSPLSVHLNTGCRNKIAGFNMLTGELYSYSSTEVT